MESFDTFPRLFLRFSLPSLELPKMPEMPQLKKPKVTKESVCIGVTSTCIVVKLLLLVFYLLEYFNVVGKTTNCSQVLASHSEFGVIYIVLLVEVLLTVGAFVLLIVGTKQIVIGLLKIFFVTILLVSWVCLAVYLWFGFSYVYTGKIELASLALPSFFLLLNLLCLACAVLVYKKWESKFGVVIDADTEAVIELKPIAETPE